MAHIHEKVDFTASVFVVHDGKVLLHKHKKHNTWLQPGGHVELDEDPNETAVREVKEETGLDVELVGYPPARVPELDNGRRLIAPRFMDRHYVDETHAHEHIDLAYFGRASSADFRPEEEGREMRWFTREEIERDDIGLLPNIRVYALAALDEIGGQ